MSKPPLASRREREKESPRPTAPAGELRAELRAVAARLTDVFLHLADLATSLPVTAEESSMEDLADSPGAVVEIRTTILCGMADHLRPLIVDFLLAAGLRPAEVERAVPALPDALLLPAMPGEEVQ